MFGLFFSVLKNKNYFSLFVQHQWLPHVVAIPRPKCASSRFSAAIPYPPNNNNNKNPFQPKGVGIDLNLRFFFVTETEESESSRSDYDNASATTQTNNNKGFLENIVEVLEKLDNNNNINNHVTWRNSVAS
ncbi:hypothetical protein JHK85_010029 [Glycine max]|nr:hypothetical protein JHK85_010029 [Glycine max]